MIAVNVPTDILRGSFCPVVVTISDGSVITCWDKHKKIKEFREAYVKVVTLLSPSSPLPPSPLSFSSHLSQCSFNTVACDDDSIPLVSAPSLKQLPRQTTLHHARARHDHTRTNIIKLINVL